MGTKQLSFKAAGFEESGEEAYREVVRSAIRALGRIALQQRGECFLTAQEVIDVHQELVYLLELLNDEGHE